LYMSAHIVIAEFQPKNIEIYSVSKNCPDVLVIQLKVTISPWKHYKMLQFKMHWKALNLSFPVIYSVFVFVLLLKCYYPINLKNTSRQFFCSLLTYGYLSKLVLCMAPLGL
jgi:hypothetical protein